MTEYEQIKEKIASNREEIVTRLNNPISLEVLRKAEVIKRKHDALEEDEMKKVYKVTVLKR